METLQEAIMRFEPRIDLLQDCLGFGRFAEVTVTGDGFSLARDRDDIGFCRFLGVPFPTAMERAQQLFARLDKRHQGEVARTMQAYGNSMTNLGLSLGAP